MNRFGTLGTVVAGVILLAGCNSNPQEQAADNIEAQADAVADNMDAIAENESSPSAENREMQADAVRAHTENEADAVRNGADHTGNGM